MFVLFFWRDQNHDTEQHVSHSDTDGWYILRISCKLWRPSNVCTFKQINSSCPLIWGKMSALNSYNLTHRTVRIFSNITNIKMCSEHLVTPTGVIFWALRVQLASWCTVFETQPFQVEGNCSLDFQRETSWTTPRCSLEKANLKNSRLHKLRQEWSTRRQTWPNMVS